MIVRSAVFLIAVLGIRSVSAEEYVDHADANGDGFVSLYELRAAHYADPEFNKQIETTFANYDRDGDGLISESERLRGRASADRSQGRAVQSPQAVDHPMANTGRIGAGDPVSLSGETSSSRSLHNDKSRAEVTIEKSQPGAVSAASNTTENIQRTTSSAGPSRTETWISQIDSDHSGGASMAELIASGDGVQWFSKQDFDAADRDDDGDLNATELAMLVSSLERRQR